jgi:opacity protein-like surface antigen
VLRETVDRLPPVKSRLFALAAVSAVALVPAAQSADQPWTTAPPPVSNIKITITDTGINVSPKFAQRGSMGRFILVNTGKKPHTFVLGHERRGTGVQTGFKKALKPSQQSVLILFLDFRGAIPYHSPLPADRSKPRMQGIFRII